MARVVFPDSFVAFTEGEREYHTQADNYRDLVAELRAKWPSLSDMLENTAVAIRFTKTPFWSPSIPRAKFFLWPGLKGDERGIKRGINRETNREMKRDERGIRE